MRPGQWGDRGQGGDGVRCERDRPRAAAGEPGRCRDADDLPGRYRVDLASAQRPFGPVDGERSQALLDIGQDEEVVSVPVVRREADVGGFGVEAGHRDRRQAGALPVAVDRRPVGPNRAQPRRDSG